MPASDCLRDSAIADYLARRLPAAAQAQFHQHLDGCPACRRLVSDAALATSVDACDAAPPEPAPERIEEYRLIRPLGQGAMGQVYLAHDTQLDRPVAIKRIAWQDATPEDRERFFIEARAVARLAHPNIVAIHRVGETGGRPYLVSELVQGRSLDQLPLPLPWAQVVAIGRGLAQGLAAAHERGVLHRDIKLANAMLTEGGEVKLLDFGLAKLVASEPSAPPGPPAGAAPVDAASPPALTLAGSLVGSPRYMAPEIWRGEAATPRSDLYSLGVVLYELCAGRPPHLAPTASALRDEVLAGPAPPLRRAATKVPARLAAIVDRCLQKDPAARFASAAALVQALERCDANPRRRWLMPLVGVCVAALALGAAGWRLRQAEIARAALAPANDVAPCERDPAAGDVRGDEGRLRIGGHRGQGDRAVRCSSPLVAWCDARERHVACCAEGLIPYGGDGGCGCPPGGSNQAAAIEVGCPRAAPSWIEEKVREQIQQHIYAMKDCYEQELEKNENLQGKLLVQFTITASGAVRSPRIEGASLPAPQAQRCVVGVLRRLRFPPPPEGYVLVTYPIRFHPVP